MARLYRQAPLNAVWEGSGNVICLDVLRCLHREPAYGIGGGGGGGCTDAWFEESSGEGKGGGTDRKRITTSARP